MNVTGKESENLGQNEFCTLIRTISGKCFTPCYDGDTISKAREGSSLNKVCPLMPFDITWHLFLWQHPGNGGGSNESLIAQRTPISTVCDGV